MDRWQGSRIRDGFALGLHLPELGWALATWAALAAFELLPALALWDVVSRQPTQVSTQHLCCSAALGAWVGLAWLHAHQRMARLPTAAPPWVRLLPGLAIPIAAFAALPSALPFVAAWLGDHGHAHDVGVLEPPSWFACLTVVLWTTAVAAIWVRAFPARARWGALVLLALGWLLSPHAQVASIAVAAGCAWLAAVLWPRRDLESSD